MHAVGRLLQLAGLGLPVIAVMMQVADQITVGKMLVMAVAAFSMFYIGRILEGYARALASVAGDAPTAAQPHGPPHRARIT